MVEQVAVVPRPWAEELGVLRDGAHLVSADVVRQIEAAASFLDRPLAEEATEWIQPIPYVLLCAGDAVFVMERLSGGTEARLHGKRSLGVGGHLHPADAAHPDGLIAHGMDREWGEELFVAGVPHITPADADGNTVQTPRDGAVPARWLGVIHDASIAVGRVHVGLLFVVELPQPVEAVVRETHKLVGRWMAQDEVLAEPERLETWSLFALKLWQAQRAR